MESKKTNRVNLENKRFIFFESGLIVALAVSLMAFEWKSYENSLSRLPENNWETIDELLPVITRQNMLPPPPPVVKHVFTINIVDEPIDIPDDFPLIDFGFEGEWNIPEKVAMPEEVSILTEDTIYNTFSIEVHPEFPGGESALYNYLNKNIKYPRAAIEANIQGIVFIRFVVEKDGKLSNISVERAPADILAEEAIRVVSAMPDWNPGKQGGKAVRVIFVLPVKFKLQ